MKYALGIYSLFITLYYIAFFTFQGDFVHGLYTIPYLVIAVLFLITAFVLDIRKRAIDGEKRAKKYAITLSILNVPMVIVAFFVPLINGNRTIGEMLVYGPFLTIIMFLMLVITVPVVGFVAGMIVDMFTKTPELSTK